MLTRLIGRADERIDALLRWDEEVLQAVSGNPLLRPLARLFITATYLGDGYLWGGLALGLILFGQPSDRAHVLIGLSVMIVNIAIFRMFKLLFARPRPLLVTSTFRSRFIDTYSFPSGHATTSFAIAWVIFSYYPYPLVRISVYLVAMTIALSRVYVKEHYPLDIISGAVLGSLVTIYLLPLLERLLL